ncbi:MAG: NusG domain II-containing protein [Bacteroidetes bacterium]|nr:NusG domain II-containing protein [Bacteroidota bacterium]
MNRRSFLIASSMAVAAGTILPSALKALTKTGITSSTEENFSLEVITDNPDKASAMLEKFAKEGNFQTTNLKYAEYSVSGNAVGDIVLVKNGRLIDFTNSNDNLSQGLKEIRSTLKLPSLISNPVRVRLFTKSDNNASKIFVMQKGQIIKQIDPLSYGNYSFTGKAGITKINISESGVKIMDSDCRHKICSKMKAITKAGDFLTCIPNELHIFAE